MSDFHPKRNRRWGLWISVGLSCGLLGVLFFWDRVAPPESSRSGYALADGQSPNKAAIELALSKSQDLALPPETVEELGKKLKFKNPADVLNQAEEFSERLMAGFIPKDWEEKCPKPNSRPVCAAVDDFFVQYRLEAISKRKRAGRLSVSVQEKNIERLQRENYGPLVRSIPKQKKGYDSWVEKSLATTSCPRNFSLALARKLEENLPDKKAWEQIKSLDEHGLSCLNVDDPFHEPLYLRAGLLRVYQGLWSESISFFEKALMSVEKREEYRSLYWLGVAHEKTSNKEKSASYFATLSERFPVSWYHLANPIQTKQDPLLLVVSRPTYKDQYDFNGDDVSVMRMRWLRLLLHLDKSDFAITKYGEWMLSKLPQDVPPAFLQHTARILEAKGFHKLQIQAANMIVTRHPSTVNLETMRLLFPKPFFDELDKNTPNFDTAILIGLARQESGFDVRARSGANARGLLQVLPSTAKTIKRAPTEKLYDSSHNIYVGARFFARLLKKFDNKVEFALAGYNAGGGRVDRWVPQFYKADDVQLWMDLIPFRETRDYVPSILRNAYWYHRLYDEIQYTEKTDYVYSELVSRELKRFNGSLGPKPSAVAGDE